MVRDEETESKLTPLTGEVLQPACNTTDETRGDIRARGIVRNAQDTFIDTRITNLNGASARKRTLASIYAGHER